MWVIKGMKGIYIYSREITLEKKAYGIQPHLILVFRSHIQNI